MTVVQRGAVDTAAADGRVGVHATPTFVVAVVLENTFELKFVHPGAGVVVIDGRKKPGEIHRRDVPADCTVHVDPLLNLAILQGHVNQNTAFRQGKIRIVGDVSVVTRLRPLMLRQSHAAEDGHRE